MAASRHDHGAGPLDATVTEDPMRDPVCGMQVEADSAAGHTVHAGTTYYFCSSHCADRFESDPDRYVETTGRSVPTRPTVDADVEYTCPMHPQIRQMGPGSCPICGMALEPVLATAEAGESPELKDMSRRFWVGLLMTIPVVVLEMGGHLVDLHHYMTLQTSNWLQFLFGTPVVLWAGWPFFVRGWLSLKNRSLNMFTLVALGTGADWLY